MEQAPKGRSPLPWLVLLVALASAGNGLLQVAPGGLHLKLGDQFAYAAAGRTLAEGGGLQSSELRAYSLALVDQEGGRVDRDTRFPADLFSGGWPLVLAGVFRVFGASDAVYQGLNVALYALLGVVLFLFGRALGGAWAGLAAVVLLLCHTKLLLDGFSVGLEIPLVLMICTAALLLYARSGLLSAAAAGALLAYAYFVRPTAVCFMPLGLLALFGREDRCSPGRLALFAGVLVVLVVGFTGLAAALSPAPLVPGHDVSYLAQSLLYDTVAYPGKSIQLSAVVPTWQAVAALRMQVLRKFVQGLYQAADTASGVFPVHVLALVPLGFLAAGVRRRRSDAFALLAAASWLGIVALASLTFSDNLVRYELPAGILVIPFAGAGLVALQAELRTRWGRAAGLAVLVVLLAAGGLRLIEAQRAFGLGAGGSPNRALAPEISALCPPGGLVATHDIEGLRDRAFIGWYGRCRSVALTGSAQEVNRLLAQRVEADAFITYLSDQAFREGTGGKLPEKWIAGYRLVKRLTVRTPERGVQELGLWVPDRGRK
jgi:hypothetical protein